MEAELTFQGQNDTMFDPSNLSSTGRYATIFAIDLGVVNHDRKAEQGPSLSELRGQC